MQPQPLNGDVASLPEEPIIRVGLYRTTDDRMVVRAVNGGFALYEGGSKVCDFGSGQSVTVTYDRGARVSRASGPGCTTQSTGVYVAQSTVDPWAPLEMVDFSRPVAWLPGANDNTFRGKLELRYAPKTDAVWIINELPIEHYLKGMAETSDVSPQQFQRTLMTAARTYALYHVYRGTKHADENYTVDAKYDQVYRGYGAEARSPNIVAGVDATRGQIVTYNGSLAITPYFSRSDGRTRSWGEVWYGGSQYPWLVGVPVPQDEGKTLWGHGVGMSASGALLMAAREGKTYDQILSYFYSGTELRRAYR
jgi:peptidoglycan hydrolase-like amidase